jgi:hypothetical protein
MWIMILRAGFLFALAAIAGCSGNGHAPDAAIPIDAVDLRCDSYCAVIQANCTGSNAQYAGIDISAGQQSCTRTCESFAMGTSVDETSGNTLACRLHYAVGASNPTADPDTCAQAGPVGAVMSRSPELCSGDDACTTFCALEIKACGSVEAPLMGDPKDAANNPIYKYRNMANCMRLCSGLEGDPGFDKTHAYSPLARGDSLACRLYQATQAVISVMPEGVTFCPDTAAPPTGRCAGPATP